MRRTLSFILLSLVISFVFFNFLKLSINMYFISYCSIFIFIKINLSIKNNKDFFNKYLLFNLIFLSCFIINRFKDNVLFHQTQEYIFYVIIIMHLIFFKIWIYEHEIKKRECNNDEISIIPKRLQDLKMLEDYIDKFNVVGLNGSWGTGKSFIVNYFKEKHVKEYEFIEIDLLTSNLNEVQLTLMDAFEDVLLKNKILPKYTNKLKRSASSLSLIGKAQNFLNLILNSNELKSSVFKSFIDETKKLEDKKFLVIFEDIDRVENKDILKEIFAISEKIANENVKILYQYDESLLVNSGFTFEYLEKYIPFKLNITNLHLTEIINFLFEENSHLKSENLSEEDFLYLSSMDLRFRNIFRMTNSKFIVHSDFGFLPFRKVENMIVEISNMINKNSLFLKNKELLISFFVIKHFLPMQFKKFSEVDKVDVLKIFSFKDKAGNIHSTIDLINPEYIKKHMDDKKESTLMNEIFIDKENIHLDENKMNLVVLKLFNYEILDPKMKNQDRFTLLKNKYKHSHEKQNRTIQKLLYQGSSEFTNHEFFKQKFIQMVLSENPNKKETYSDFIEYFFKMNKYVVGNSTILKIGKSNMESLFEAFNLSGEDGKEFINLLRFYLNHFDKKNIDITIIKCINHIVIDSEKNLLDLIEIISCLEVETNFNTTKEFKSMLEKIIGELFSRGIVEDERLLDAYNLINIDSEINEDYLNQLSILLNQIERNIQKFENLHLNKLVITLKSASKFIEKMREIITSPIMFEEESNSPRVSYSSKLKNQDVYDDLKADYYENILSENKDKILLNEINIKYEEEKITLSEVVLLIKELDIPSVETRQIYDGLIESFS